jgi:hypothetical protein
MSTTIELSAWIEKIKSARTRTELFAMLDSFRVGEWTDEQRSSIAKLYMRLLDYLPHEESTSGASDDTNGGGSAKPAEQEEVWYEKM